MAKKDEKTPVKKQKKNKKKSALPTPAPKDFFDLIAPSVAKFSTDHFILGSTYRCVLALRGYPTSTDELALLRHIGEKSGVTLHIYTRQVTAAEQGKIIHNAANRSRMERSNTTDIHQSVTAEANLQDVAALVTTMHRNREPLMHCAVFLELSAGSSDRLRNLRDEVLSELGRSKLSADALLLRQREGYMTANPAGANALGTQFERVLPSSSVANLFPFNYSGKTDPHGFYIGRDRYGTNVIVDLDRRADDKTNASGLILGNSGQGESFLLKLLVCNLLESGKSVICLDPEHEMCEMSKNLDGYFIDLMSGKYIINPLEPKLWDVTGSDDEDDPDAPETFRQHSRLSQHISFLKDFFRTYKDFTDREIDTIELLLIKLYEKFNISDDTDWSKLKATDYPILSDFYELIEAEYKAFNPKEKSLYTAENLQNICLGLHSLCKGAESKFFDGHTNITDNRFVTFGVKGLLQASKNIRNALLFNVLAYMSEQLLSRGNTVASIDEFYLFLTNLTAVEYIRNFMKRVRKKESAVILASQNIEDFLVENVRELTKPLFSIPTHHFLFYPGTIEKKTYMDTLQVEASEYALVQYSQQGVCLYKCGNERYCLCVKAPDFKAALFGTAGGR